MTRQTSAPIERLHLENTYRSARELIRMMDDGLMTADLPYQRGDVWAADQRIALIRSWLSGTPIPSIIINDRYTGTWADANGAMPVDEPGYAVIDGRQRLETARLWYAGKFAVPASWFLAEDVEVSEDTDDGPYVRYNGLTAPAQRDFAMNKALFPFAAAKVGTVRDEAEIYLRVNGAGTPQTDEDMERAAGIAGR
jgi:hypothetical protein